ncbi:MAG: hypothetical protein Q7R53_01115 [bacterium]|nr:hypothetical protein [bacterium]
MSSRAENGSNKLPVGWSEGTVVDRAFPELEERDEAKLAQGFEEAMEELLHGRNSRILEYGIINVKDRRGPGIRQGTFLCSEDWPDLLGRISNGVGKVRLTKFGDHTYSISIEDNSGESVSFSLRNGNPEIVKTVPLEGSNAWTEERPTKDKRLKTKEQKLRYGLFVALRVKDANPGNSWQNPDA